MLRSEWPSTDSQNLTYKSDSTDRAYMNLSSQVSIAPMAGGEVLRPIVDGSTEADNPAALSFGGGVHPGIKDV